MGHLVVPADAPLAVRVALDGVLYSHIGGGAVGMVSGAVALVTRKGGRIHRASGNLFFAAMLVMSGIGFIVSPMLNDRVSTVAGLMTFYLVASGWLTVKRPSGAVGRLEIAAALIPLGVVLMGFIFIRMAAASSDGMVDGQPPQANYVFAAVGAIALLGDAHLILRRGLKGAPRITRHLWRMCVALLVASGSFFLGQLKFLPKAMIGTPLQFAPILIPLVLMVFWLGHTWWKARPRRRPPTTPLAA
jgi:uncharacterized membrane protein